MIIRDLINALEELEKKELELWLVPEGCEIMIDIFNPTFDGNHTYTYGGFSKEIKIQRSDDGVYPILCAFSDLWTKGQVK